MTLSRRFALILDIDAISEENIFPFVAHASAQIALGYDELWLRRQNEKTHSASFAKILTELEKSIFVPIVRWDARLGRANWQRLRAQGGDRVALDINWLNPEALTEEIAIVERAVGFDRISVFIPVERMQERSSAWRVLGSECASPMEVEQVCLQLCEASVGEIIFTGEVDAGLMSFFTSLLPVPIGFLAQGFSEQQVLDLFLAGADSVLMHQIETEGSKINVFRQMLRKNGFPLRF